jgi:hypothetical protein
VIAQKPQLAEEKTAVLGSELMFPDPEHVPPGCPECPSDQLVPASVGVELEFPEFRVVCGQAAMDGTAMPETAVDKHCRPALWKHKVGPAKHGPVSAPAGDALGPEDRGKGALGVPVAAGADLGHYLGPFGF